MPVDLRKAHNQLDRAVETLYGIKAGSTVAQRLTTLLTEYRALAPKLALRGTPTKTGRKKRASK